jgi:hypothetical protein
MAKTFAHRPDREPRAAQWWVLSLLACVLVVIAVPSVGWAATCTPSDIRSGTCVSAGIDGDHVDLEGSETGAGSGHGNGNGNGSGSGNNSTGDDDADPRTPGLHDGWGLGRDPFFVTSPLTLADIAHFRPNPGVDHMEPNGWMIVGLDTNFYSTGGVQVHDGELLGRAASVRFTPVAWHWTYGDGQGASRGAPGAPWASQGIAEFDPTPTSHVYAAPGTYYIDLAIDFRAEYRYSGSPWVPIAGTLTVPANRLVATAGSAKTVLVERECTINPAGPGC